MRISLTLVRSLLAFFTTLMCTARAWLENPCAMCQFATLAITFNDCNGGLMSQRVSLCVRSNAHLTHTGSQLIGVFHDFDVYRSGLAREPVCNVPVRDSGHHFQRLQWRINEPTRQSVCAQQCTSHSHWFAAYWRFSRL